MSYRVTLPDGQDPIAISHAEANLEDALLWLKRDLEKYGGSSDRNVASGCYLFRLETQGKPPCRKAMSKGHVERLSQRISWKQAGCSKEIGVDEHALQGVDEEGGFRSALARANRGAMDLVNCPNTLPGTAL